MVPLCDKMEGSYSKIKAATISLKGAMGFVYGAYACSFYAALLLPRFVNKYSLDKLGKKFTISFTNSAGPLKPFDYKSDTDGKIITNISSQSYIQVSGILGFALTIVSQSGSLFFTLTSDENVCDQETNMKIMKLLHQNLDKEIKRVNESKKNQ